MSFRKSFSVAIAALVTIVATAGPASAHHWWSPWVWQTTKSLSIADRTTPFPVDNRTWQWDSGVTALGLTYRWWDCVSIHGCVMVWEDSNMPGLYGTAELQRYPDGGLRGVNIRLNPAVAVTPEQRSKTTCHELGHALLLGEHPGTGYTGSCMRQGASPPIVDYPDWHDFAEINLRQG